MYWGWGCGRQAGSRRGGHSMLVDPAGLCKESAHVSLAPGFICTESPSHSAPAADPASWKGRLWAIGTYILIPRGCREAGLFSSWMRQNPECTQRQPWCRHRPAHPGQVLSSSTATPQAYRWRCHPTRMDAGALWSVLVLPITSLQGVGPKAQAALSSAKCRHEVQPPEAKAGWPGGLRQRGGPAAKSQALPCSR